MPEQRFFTFFDDFVFKWIFGRRGNERLLLKLLNELLHFKDDDCIVSLTLLNPFNLQESRRAKLSIVDVKACDGRGRQFTIEVQATSQPAFINRALYYLAKLYSSQLKNHDDYGILRPSFGVNLLNFVLFPDHENIQSTYSFQERNSHDLLSNAMELHFIEVPKLALSRERCLQSRFEKWLHVLKNGEQFGSGKEPLDELSSEEDMIMAVEELKKINADDEMRAFLEDCEKARRDELSARNAARREGLEEGLEKGLERGREGGREFMVNLVIRQIERKFGPLNEPDRRRISEANESTLLELGERLVTATDLEEIFKH